MLLGGLGEWRRRRAGVVIAGFGVTAAGRDVVRAMIGGWPGFGVLRDAQQFVAPLALAEAVGLGLVVTAAMDHGPFGRKGVSRCGRFARTRPGPCWR